MYYDITFNRRKLKQISASQRVAYEQIGPVLGIDREHFEEKNNWYKIDGLLQYFKQREDSRVLGELLSDAVLKMHGFETASYSVSELNGVRGLLSPNVHKEGYRYESVATLHRIYPDFGNPYYSDSRRVTLKRIFEFLNSVDSDNQEIKVQIIRKYVIDWFTHQLDDNIRNLTFEQASDGKLRLATIIDSESSFAATKKGINTDFNRIWVPAIPYEDSEFSSGPSTIDGLDLNIISLLVEYPEIVKTILEEIINNDYEPIIVEFQKKADNGVYVSSDAIDFLKRFVEAKQQEANKINRI